MRIQTKNWKIYLVLLLASFTGISSVTGLESKECQDCHSDATVVGNSFVVNQTTFDTTAHADIGCPTCHASVGSGHPDDGLTPSKASCRDCHADISQKYAGSSHHDNARCNDCHNPHQVRSATAVSGHEMNQQCSVCHEPSEITALHTEWLPQAELHINMLPCVSCHTASQENVITLYVVKRNEGRSLKDLEPASYAELQSLAKDKNTITLIDGNEDNYISLAELRLFNLDPKNNLRLQGMMTPEFVTHDFRTLANRRDCSFCHASGTAARQTSFISLAQSDGSFRRVAVEKGAVLDALYGTPDFYMVGSTRSTMLNYLGAFIIAGGLIMPIGHGSLRFLTRKNRKEEGEAHHE